MDQTRRALLVGVAGGGIVGTAGCLGDDDPDTGTYDCELEEPDAPEGTFRPTIGDPDADVVVQAFEDFTCGGCATYKLQQFPSIKEEYIDPGTIRYEHWDFPIPVDEDWAVPVASAARGVGDREGHEAFFEFASTVYESHPNYDLETIGDAAEAAGADPCSAIVDAQFETYAATVDEDKDAGITRGVGGTPTVFVNDEEVDTPTADDIADAIDDAL